MNPTDAWQAAVRILDAVARESKAKHAAAMQRQSSMADALRAIPQPPQASLDGFADDGAPGDD